MPLFSYCATGSFKNVGPLHKHIKTAHPDHRRNFQEQMLDAQLLFTCEHCHDIFVDINKHRSLACYGRQSTYTASQIVVC